MLQAGQRHEDAGEMKQPAGFQMLIFEFILCLIVTCALS